MNSPSDRRNRILILAPVGRDAAVAAAVLAQAALAAEAVADVAALVGELDRGVGAVLLTEEALRREEIRDLTDWLARQPRWSDLPFVVLTSNGDTARHPLLSLQVMDALHNVTLLERPIQAVTLISAVTSALRARRRQYEVERYLTERERAEAELRQLNDTLEQRVADRTRRLEESHRRLLEEIEERRRTEDALRQAQKMQAVGQLTGGVAHDFNNVLTVIGANLDLLGEKLDGQAGLRRLVDSATRGVDRAAKLTQQLLAFSRKQRLEPRPVDVQATIGGTEDLLRRTAGDAIEIRHVFADALWSALADPNQLETALLNLVLNARDAMAERGVITISARNVEIGPADCATVPDAQPGAYVEIAVADTGTGMPPDILTKVFEPFFTTKAVGKGSGLGLSMVYGFARQSNGFVTIESEVGKGTTMRLFLPRAQSAVSRAAPTRLPRADGAAAARDGWSGTILVVEDNPDVREVAVSVLNDFGFSVLEAENAAMALDVLAQNSDIALVFTDVVMPGEMNGMDLAKTVAERWPRLRLIVTSGYAERLVHSEKLPENVDFLSKPYKPLDLVARIKSSLERPAAHAQPSMRIH